MATKTNTRASRSLLPAPRSGFTLVELLVVITIIGILASLVTVAAVAALKAARRGAIIAEISQISTGMEEYKNKTTAYPPNVISFQDSSATGYQPAGTQVLADLRRHMKTAFGRSHEPEALLTKLAGQFTGSEPQNLAGGMTASEALVFWLSGASADPKYPISGEGGIAYPATLGAAEPVESRTWIYPFAIERLGPRDPTTNQFNGRFVVYTHPVNGQEYRINFWEYFPSGSEQPYVYFDASRQGPDQVDPLGFFDGRHVHALKILENPGATNQKLRFANNGKFQILHSGLDNEWGEFDEMSLAHVGGDATQVLTFPDGPFVGEIADTLTNFTEGTLEDSQP